MSIHAAVMALDKEIEVLDKRRVRLVLLREALVVEDGAVAEAAVSLPLVKGKPGPKPGAKKSGLKPGKKKPGPKPAGTKATVLTKAAAQLNVPTAKKRVMSLEARKRIGDAVKASWAAKAKAKKAA